MPIRQCLRCDQLVRDSSYCAFHQLEADINREKKASRKLLKGGEWKRQRAKALSRDNYQCVRCGNAINLTVDHLIPRSKGGTNELSNLQTLCTECHITKTREDNR